MERTEPKPGPIRDWKHETDNVLLRSEDKGKNWGDLITIASEKEVDIHRGPVLIDNRDITKPRIYSFMRYSPARVGQIKGYKKPVEFSEEAEQKHMKKNEMGDYVSYSDNDGKKWSKPKQIFFPYPKGAIGVGLGNGSHGIRLANGRFVIQARYKQKKKTKDGWKWKQKRVLLYLDEGSLDEGGNWNHGAIIETGGINMSKQEFTIVESPKNVVLASFRTAGINRAGGKGTGDGRVMTRIKNATKVTEEPKHLEQINTPNAHASLIRKNNKFKTYYLSLPGSDFDADAKVSTKSDNRDTMTLYRSLDGAQTWDRARIDKKGAYAGYSDMAMFKDGSIAIIYESGKNENYEFMIYKHLKVD